MSDDPPGPFAPRPLSPAARRRLRRGSRLHRWTRGHYRKGQLVWRCHTCNPKPPGSWVWSTKPWPFVTVGNEVRCAKCGAVHHYKVSAA